MKIYLVMMEKNDADYDGSVVFTHTDREKAIEFAEHLFKIHSNPTWVDEWPLESIMTYQNVRSVFALG